VLDQLAAMQQDNNQGDVGSTVSYLLDYLITTLELSELKQS